MDGKLRASWFPVVPGTMTINGIQAMDQDVDWATGEIKKSGALPGDWLEYSTSL
jgi:hypothetical protein